MLTTVDTSVAGFQVDEEVHRAGLLLLVKIGVGYMDSTRLSSGAAGVHQRQHVGRAADVDVGLLGADAPAEPHPPVPGRLHDDHVP